MLPIIYFLTALFTIPYLVPLKGEEQNFSIQPYVESSYYQRNGIEVHYREWNKESSDAICLISGLGGSTYSWRNIIPDLVKQGYHVIAIDPPPFGYSTKEEGVNHSVTYNAGLAWSLLDSKKISSCIVAGHSMGAAIIAAMTDTLPGRVKAAVYVDGGAFNLTEDFDLFRFDPIQRWAEIIGHYYLFTPERFSPMIRSAFGREPKAEEVQEILKPFLMRNSAASVFDLAASGDTRKLNGAYKNVHSLVIWGTEDNWIPVSTGEKFFSKLSNAELVKIVGGGHCPMETNYDDFRKHLLHFMKQIE